MKKRVCALTDNQGTVTLGHLKTPLNPNRNVLWVSWLSLAGNQHCKVGEGRGGLKI